MVSNPLKNMTPSALKAKIGTMLQEQAIPETNAVRTVGRKATITKEELFQAKIAFNWSAKSIASLSLREVAREAGIAPNSFYRHFKDIDELAIELIDRSGLVLRQILHEARLKASKQNSIIRSSVEVFIEQLNIDKGNLSLFFARRLYRFSIVQAGGRTPAELFPARAERRPDCSGKAQPKQIGASGHCRQGHYAAGI